MEIIEAKDLHVAVKFLKELRVQMVGDLPHYGNYGLFFKNDEITTGLMNNTKEIKINLLDGNFHYYDTELGWTYDLTKTDAPTIILEFLNSKGFSTPETSLSAVSISQMHSYRKFAIQANQYLEQLRMRLTGQYTQVYLWGHNFDFDLVWYTGSPSDEGYDEQLDIGVSPGDGGHPMPYLYVTPRPFNDSMAKTDLPIGKWVTDSWKGILVEWDEILSKPLGEGVNLLFELYTIASNNFN